MHRRGLATFVAALVLTLMSPFAGLGVASLAGASTDDEPVPTRPPITVSDFIPEDSNLSDCVGLVERPGCGSESRGGWRQAAVFGVLAIGLGVIIWRISVGVRRNRNP